MKYLTHTSMRSNASQFGLHVLNQRAFGFRAQITNGNPIMRSRIRIDDLHHGIGISEYVFPRLVEKLE